jgi:hypothetical protein
VGPYRQEGSIIMTTTLNDAARKGRGMPRWPLFLIGAPAAVAVWSGWVGLGGLCGFGPIHPLPGIVPGFQLNTAITLPVGIEAYGSYALGAWLRSAPGTPARSFGRTSAVGALTLGMLGQAVYHILAAMHATRAPWPVVVFVSCLPVVSLGFGAALAHLLSADPGTVPLPRGTPPAGRVPGPGIRPVPAAASSGAPVPAAAVPGPAPRNGAAGAAAARAAGSAAEPGLLEQFRAELAAGAPPSIRTIRSRMHVGQERAQQVQGALAAYLAGRPMPAPADDRVPSVRVPAVAGSQP